MKILIKSRSTRILLGSLAILLVIAITFLFGYYKIPQNGMYPTLPAGSHVFAFKHAYSKSSDVKRGDVVVFFRNQNGQRRVYIWRVIGLPGELITTFGDSLTVNGKPPVRKLIRDDPGTTIFREGLPEATYEIAISHSPKQRPPDVNVQVPADQFFVMGDNRLDAYDSRYFGPVEFSSIIARRL